MVSRCQTVSGNFSLIDVVSLMDKKKDTYSIPVEMHNFSLEKLFDIGRLIFLKKYPEKFVCFFQEKYKADVNCMLNHYTTILALSNSFI